MQQIGIGIGQSIYWGDLNGPSFNTNFSKNNGFAIQIFGRRYVNNIFAVKANLLFSKVKGDDAFSSQQWQKERNLRFQSVLHELSFSGEYYPFKFLPGREESILSPFLSAGFGAFYFNPTTTYQGNKYELQPLGTEGQGMPGFADKYNRIAASLLFGGGLAIQVGETTTLHLELIGRRSTTDYLDDISGSYVNYQELRNGNGELAARLGDRTNEFFNNTEPISRETGAQRGGALVNDYYFSTTISAAFKFGGGSSFGTRRSKVMCPSF